MNTQTTDAALDIVRWNNEGLAPAIAQDIASGRVLMLAWMNRAALAATFTEGRAVYWSRSRKTLWRKGESSGNMQRVREIRIDCDADAVLLQVEQHGGIACHTGRASCFYRHLEEGVWCEVDPVLRDPRQMYADTEIRAESGTEAGTKTAERGE